MIEESLEIMHWALSKSDPDGWLKMPITGYDWISRNDRPFKRALDHTKYSRRYPEVNSYLEQKKSAEFLFDLDKQIANKKWMFGENCSWADMAILPFIRQFANINNDWFDSQGWYNINRLLKTFLDSRNFNSIMIKYEKWVPENHVVLFPGKQALFAT